MFSRYFSFGALATSSFGFIVFQVLLIPAFVVIAPYSDNSLEVATRLAVALALVMAALQALLELVWWATPTPADVRLIYRKRYRWIAAATCSLVFTPCVLSRMPRFLSEVSFFQHVRSISKNVKIGLDGDGFDLDVEDPNFDDGKLSLVCDYAVASKMRFAYLYFHQSSISYAGLASLRSRPMVFHVHLCGDRFGDEGILDLVRGQGPNPGSDSDHGRSNMIVRFIETRVTTGSLDAVCEIDKCIRLVISGEIVEWGKREPY